ncbi:MAG TPA: nitroreductase family protein [Candidatus Bathyarchaeia archaeon]|nr:nitroreductase family protein [Candidatus Bathyarchaeia archaeon]
MKRPDSLTNANSAHKNLKSLLDTITERRSVRRFRQDGITDADLRTLVFAATRAPSGGNMQPWFFTIVKNQHLKDRLASVILQNVNELNQSDLFFRKATKSIRKYSTFFKNAPIVIAVLVKLYDRTYIDSIVKFMNVDAFEAVHLLGFAEVQSVAAAIENLLLVAHAMDYGACWMRVPFCSKNNLERELGVEKPWHLLAFIPIGLPDEKPKAIARKAVEEVMKIIE